MRFCRSVFLQARVGSLDFWLPFQTLKVSNNGKNWRFKESPIFSNFSNFAEVFDI